MNNKMVEVSKLDLYPTRLMGFRYNQYKKMNMKICLLYTSDAADE